MLANPESQRRAHEELDNVIGLGQLPQFSDRDSLPFVNAIVKEVLRWQPVTPLGEDQSPLLPPDSNVIGIPHALSEEDVFNGYAIPKGSLVISNVW